MKGKLSSLTNREREVLALLASGESNRELAQRLGVSPRTIQKHLQRIYAKLGVKRRMAAVALAVQRDAHGDSESKLPQREESSHADRSIETQDHEMSRIGFIVN
jgi:DNA-binding CsgD family transcriptional regulator